MASTVGTTTDRYSIRTPPQRNAFYAAGRFWVFYCDPNENDLVFRTSVDGENWTDKTEIGPLPCPFGVNFDIHFDGTYIHYGRNLDYMMYRYWGIMYRRGTPQSNGTITWSAVEQLVLNDMTVADDMSLTVDSDGYPWFGYCDFDFARAKVITSSTNDGTWSTRGGYPLTLDDVTTGVGVFLIPQTDGKLCAMFWRHRERDAIRIRARFYNGIDTWSAVEYVTAVDRKISMEDFAMLCATSIYDEIHLVYHPDGENTIQYLHGHEGTWSGETEIEDASHVASQTSPVISHWDDVLYVFWLHSDNHVYYKKYDEGWETVIDWIDETADGFPNDRLIQCFFESFDKRIGVCYQTLMDSPYNVRFAYVLLPEETWQVDTLFKLYDIEKASGVDTFFLLLPVVTTQGASDIGRESI